VYCVFVYEQYYRSLLSSTAWKTSGVLSFLPCAVLFELKLEDITK